MFAKLTTVFAILAVAAQVAVATPPACVIAAVNTQEDPSDIKSVCAASAVKQYMSKNCGDNLDAANSAFDAVCKDAGVTVSSSSSASTSSATSKSASASGSASGKSTGTITSTNSRSASGTSVPTGTLGGAYAIGTAGTAASSGFLTATANGTYSAPTASTSGTGSAASASPTESVVGSTGGAGRLGMDIMGMAVVGVFGAMLAL